MNKDLFEVIQTINNNYHSSTTDLPPFPDYLTSELQQRGYFISNSPYSLGSDAPGSIVLSADQIRMIKEANEIRLIRGALKQATNKGKAAELLGLDRKTLYKKMRKYGIEGIGERRQKKITAVKPDIHYIEKAIRESTRKFVNVEISEDKMDEFIKDINPIITKGKMFSSNLSFGVNWIEEEKRLILYPKNLAAFICINGEDVVLSELPETGEYKGYWRNYKFNSVHNFSVELNREGDDLVDSGRKGLKGLGE